MSTLDKLATWQRVRVTTSDEAIYVWSVVCVLKGTLQVRVVLAKLASTRAGTISEHKGAALLYFRVKSPLSKEMGTKNPFRHSLVRKRTGR
jgi:hypothetical protein